MQFRSRSIAVRPAVVLLAFAVVSAVFVLAGSVWGFRQHGFVSRAAEAPGHVVALDMAGDMYYPVFSYRDRQGKVHQAYSHIGSRPPGYYVGQSLTMLYDPLDPDHPLKAVPNDFQSLWFGPLFMLGFGSFMAMLVALLWPFYRHRLSSDSSGEPTPSRGRLGSGVRRQ